MHLSGHGGEIMYVNIYYINGYDDNEIYGIRI
jgi:hypothetical protein